MGLAFSMSHQMCKEKKSLTQDEKTHLVFLGSTAGTPGIVIDAVKSDNIFDPAHLERAQVLHNQQKQYQALLERFTEHQERIDAEREQLRQMGEKMDGEPNPFSYNRIEARLPSDLGLPSEDWFLRIHGGPLHVDMKLAPYKDYIADCLGDACRVVPQFRAVLHRPDMEPVVVFTQSG